MEELVINFYWFDKSTKYKEKRFTKGILLLLGCAVLKAYHTRVNKMVKFEIAIECTKAL